MLHYLDGKVHLDVFIKMEGLDTEQMSELCGSASAAQRSGPKISARSPSIFAPDPH